MNQTAVRNEATGVVASMTGYGHGQAEIETGGPGGLGGTVTCELRTVNSRFVDVQLRLADELRALEPVLRERIGRHFSRGKIECRLSWRAARSSGPGLRIDAALLDQLAAAQQQVRAHLPDAAPLTVADILHWQAGAADRGIERGGSTAADAAAETVDPGAALQRACAPLLDRVFADCVAARRREGSRLAGLIGQHVAAMRTICGGLRPKVPALLAEAQERLAARLAEALPTEGVVVGRDETFARVRQEVALLSMRGDVVEELDRLEAHLDEADQILRTGGTIGKRLDFLSQELNREANTIASKAIGIAVTDAAVDLKLAIEQLREQVQNIE